MSKAFSEKTFRKQYRDAYRVYKDCRGGGMTNKQKDMIAGVDWLLKKFNKYSDDKEFTVEEIIRASNEAVQEILTEVEG